MNELDVEVIQWAYIKLASFGVGKGANEKSAMMMDRLQALLNLMEQENASD
jgi:hypothetical protein